MGTPVTWEAKWQSPLADYLADYRSLIGDRRTAVTFGEVVQGIIGAGTLVCERIAAQSAVLAAAAGWWATGQSAGDWREYHAFAVGCGASDGAVAAAWRRVADGLGTAGAPGLSRQAPGTPGRISGWQRRVA